MQKLLETLSCFYHQLRTKQTAIAEILSDMDAEIDALTAKLNKLRNQAKGMMRDC
jgi:type I restriction enzyme S subunit